jgi:hypothetical protein
LVAGILAEKVFHYDAKEIAEGGIDHNLENAASLSSALLVSLIIPWGLCFFFYFGRAPHTVSPLLFLEIHFL